LEGFVENAVFGDECRNYIAKAIGNVIVVDSALPRYRELVRAVPVASGVQLLYRFILLYSHSLISIPPAPLLGSASALGAFRATREPHTLVAALGESPLRLFTPHRESHQDV
jgi:hypothetical protein